MTEPGRLEESIGTLSNSSIAPTIANYMLEIQHHSVQSKHSGLARAGLLGDTMGPFLRGWWIVAAP